MRRRFRLALARRSHDAVRREVDAELRFHIEERVEELVAAGVPRERAEREVRERFGDVAGVRAECEAIDAATDRRRAWRETFGTLAGEVRLATRALARSPAFSLVAMLTLALGVGATATIYSLVHGVVLRPLPYPAADRLVVVRHPVPGVDEGAEWGLSPAGYFHFRKESRTLDAVASYFAGEVNFVGDAGAERVTHAVVDPLMLSLIGARPALGRLLVGADMRPDSAPPIAVVGHRFWRDRMGADPRAVGKLLTVNSRKVEVVGVLAEGVDLPDATTDLWTPLAIDSTQRPINTHWMRVVARLRPTATPADAERELTRLVARFPELFPSAYSPRFMAETRFGVRVASWHDELLGDAPRRLRLLLGAVAVLLAVACANVANLYLARDEARRRETALRAALGASRSHFAWHALTESLLLALAGGVLGAALAFAALRVTLATAPAGIPRLAEVHLGWRGVLVAFGIAAVAGGAFGLIPLARRGLDLATLRDGGRGAAAHGVRNAARRALVVGQVALALVLLAGAGLMVQSVRRLRQVHPGFDARGVLTFEVAVPQARFPNAAAVTAFHRALAARAAALPGVVAVGATTALPLADASGCSVVWVEGKPVPPGQEPPCVATPTVSPDYFRAMGVRVAGRESDWHAVERKAGDVVVTRALAERLWPGENAVGRGIRGNGEGPPYYRVVGVSEDIRHEGLDEPPLAAVFFPPIALDGAPLWGTPRSMTVVVRTRVADPTTLAPALRRAVAELDAEVPVANVRTMQSVVARSMARTSFTTLLLGVAAALALVLSAVGLYGVVAYLVAQRRSEIGVRMALGARVPDVARLVVLQSVRLAAAGVAIGLVGAFLVTRMLRSMLYDVSPGDPTVLAVVSGVLVVIAAAASVGPARRAARVDPVEALRGQ